MDGDPEARPRAETVIRSILGCITRADPMLPEDDPAVRTLTVRRGAELTDTGRAVFGLYFSHRELMQ